MRSLDKSSLQSGGVSRSHSKKEVPVQIKMEQDPLQFQYPFVDFFFSEPSYKKTLNG
jgi:hypothetical protein